MAIVTALYGKVREAIDILNSIEREPYVSRERVKEALEEILEHLNGILFEVRNQ